MFVAAGGALVLMFMAAGHSYPNGQLHEAFSLDEWGLLLKLTFAAWSVGLGTLGFSVLWL
jgi:hypothetical protein